MLFLSFIIGYITGVGGGSFGDWGSVLILLILPLGTGLFFHGKRWIFALLAMSGILLGGYGGIVAYSQHIEDWQLFSQIVRKEDDKVVVLGVVTEKAYSQDFNETYRLKIDTIDNISTGKGAHFGEKNIGIFINIPKNLTIKNGDILSFTGKIKATVSPPIKDFERYAFIQKAYGSIFLPSFSRIPAATSISPFDTIHDWSFEVLFTGFPRDVAGALLGMILGSVELITSEMKQAFILSGTSHILVVSGSNIAFVILMITGILKYLPVTKGARIVSVFLFVLVYSTLVGWESSVIRATIMGLLTFFAIEHGKKTSSIAILFGIAFILLLLNPLALVYDAGFGLSFGATLGILVYYDVFSGGLGKIPLPKILIPIIGITLSASVGSLPVMVYHFGGISIGSFLANILIAFVLGWILMTGVLYLILATFSGYFLYFFGLLVYIPTKYVLLVSEFFALSGTITIPDGWQTPLSLVVLGYFLIDIFAHEFRRITLFQTTQKNQ